MTDSTGRITTRPLDGDIETASRIVVSVMSPSHTLASLGPSEDGGRLELRDDKGRLRMSGVATGRRTTRDPMATARRVSLGLGTGGTGEGGNSGQSIIAGEDSTEAASSSLG